MNIDSLIQPLQRAGIGAKVKKQFYNDATGELEWFGGTVTGYDGRRGQYWITYEDDDAEEMSWAELRRYLQQLPHATGSTEAAKSAQAQQKQQQQHKQKAKQQATPTGSSARTRTSLDAQPATAKQDQTRQQAAASAAAQQQQQQQQETIASASLDVLAAGAAAAVHKPAVKPGRQQQQQQRKADASAGRASGSGSSASDAGVAAAAAASAAAAPAATGRTRLLGRKTCNGAVPRPAKAAAAAASTLKRPDAAGAAAGSKKIRTAGPAAAAGNKKRKPQGEAAATGQAADAAAGQEQQQPAKKQRQAKRKSSSSAAAAADGATDIDAAHVGAIVPAAASGRAAADPIAALTFEPARVLARAYHAALAAFLQSLSPEAAAAAAEVKLVKAGKQQVPLWQVQDEHIKVHKGDVLQGLQSNAVDYEPGKEPWRRFAAAVAAAGTSGSSSNGSSTDTAEAAAVAAAAALGDRVLYVADQLFADHDAALAVAVKAANGEFWREYRLAVVTEEERVKQRKADQEKSKAEAAAAAEGGRLLLLTEHQHEDGADNEQQQEAGAAGSSSGCSSSKPPKKADVDKNPCARPDRVAESCILRSGRAVNRLGRDTFGHLPGIPINHVFALRSEAQVLGAHKVPMAGIATVELPRLEVGGEVYLKVKAATSIVMSGCYEDDHDAATDIVKYTGEGGNDLLGKKKQVQDQTLERGNRALLANIALGLPVRVFRRNDDRGGATNSVLFYDGLYDVVSWVKTRGKEGLVVYIFGLKRRPGQAASLSKPISHFKAVGTAKRGKHVLVREHIICKDVSKGKESTPIVAVNEVNRELPPGLSLEEDAEWIVDDKKDKDGPLIPSSTSFRYITANEYEEGVMPPAPPAVVEEGSPEAVAAMGAELAAAFAEDAAAAEAEGNEAAAAEAAAAAAKAAAVAQAAAAAAAAAGTDGAQSDDEIQQQQDEQQQRHQGASRQLHGRSAAAAPSAGAIAAGSVAINPSGTGGRPVDCLCWYTKDVVVKKPGEAPHDLLKRINYGHLPYVSRAQAARGDKAAKLPVSRDVCPVLTECGDWTGCTDADCDQRQGQRGVQYRLELFMSRDKGWGVQSWDSIKGGSLVCIMHGKVTRAEYIGAAGKYESSSYFFDMTPRPWGSQLTEGVEPSPEIARRCRQEKEWDAKYVLCAKEQGGVARFINHSCDPNLYVQPMCSGHTDNNMVAIGLFAAFNIPPFTELTYDYGNTYIEDNLGGVCLCGTPACKYKPQQAQEQQ